MNAQLMKQLMENAGANQGDLDDDLTADTVALDESVDFKKEAIFGHVYEGINQLATAFVTPEVMMAAADMIKTSLANVTIVNHEEDYQAAGSKLIEDLEQILKLPGCDVIRVITESNICLEEMGKRIAHDLEIETEKATTYISIQDATTEEIDFRYYEEKRDQQIDDFRTQTEEFNEMLQVRPVTTRSSSQTVSTMSSDEESDTTSYRKSKSEIEAIIDKEANKIVKRNRDEYLVACERNKATIKLKSEAKTIVANYKRLKEIASNSTCLVNAIKCYLQQFAKILKEGIDSMAKRFPTIKLQVKGIVRLMYTGEGIHDAYSTNNIGGMMAVLYKTFKGNEFDTLMNQLAYMLQFRMRQGETSFDYWGRLLYSYGVWNRLNVFPLITPEHLFMGIFLNGLHPNYRYTPRIVQDITKAIKKEDKKGHHVEGAIFQVVDEYMTNERKNLAKVNTLLNQQNNISGSGPGNFKSNNNYSAPVNKNNSVNWASSVTGGGSSAGNPQKHSDPRNTSSGGYRNESSVKISGKNSPKFSGNKRVNEESVAATSEVEVLDMDIGGKYKFMPRSSVLKENSNGEISHINGCPISSEFTASPVKDLKYMRYVAMTDAGDKMNMYNPIRNKVKLNYKVDINNSVAKDLIIDVNSKSTLCGEPITRSDKIKYWDTRSNRLHDYLAVPDLWDICSGCYPSTGGGKPCRQGKIKCYNAKCPLCDYYGHAQWACIQNCKKDGVTKINHKN